MAFSLNDDLDDMEPHPNELGEDAIVGLDVKPLTSQANPGATKEMIFTSIPAKRELPEMDKDFVILSTRVSKATDLAMLSKNIAATQRMSQEQAELAEQLSPGFVDEGTPIGMYTAIPTKTMAEETVHNIGARLDKEIMEMLATCEMVAASVIKNSDLLVKDLELECMEHLHMSSEYMSVITKHLKDNPGFKFNSGERAVDIFNSHYSWVVGGSDNAKRISRQNDDDRNDADRCTVSANFLHNVKLGSGIIILPGGKEMSPTDDGSDTIINTSVECKDTNFTIDVFVNSIFGNNSIAAIRDIATMLTVLKNKAEYYLNDAKERLASEDMADKREEKLTIIMEYLAVLNSLNTAARSANDLVYRFMNTCGSVMQTLGEFSEKIKAAGIPDGRMTE